MYTVFEWDEQKAASNFEKHGLSFETAALAFTDPFALRAFDQVKDGEARWHLIGWVGSQVVVVVTHTVTEANDEGVDIEVIRLISARKAEPKERRRYRNAYDPTQD